MCLQHSEDKKLKCFLLLFERYFSPLSQISTTTCSLRYSTASGLPTSQPSSSAYSSPATSSATTAKPAASTSTILRHGWLHWHSWDRHTVAFSIRLGKFQETSWRTSGFTLWPQQWLASHSGFRLPDKCPRNGSRALADSLLNLNTKIEIVVFTVEH